MNKYHKDASPLRFAPPSTVLTVLGALVLPIGAVIFAVGLALRGTLAALAYYVGMAGYGTLCLGFALVALAGVLAVGLPDEDVIRFMVCRALFDPARGNPLGFRDGELLPIVACYPAKAKDGYSCFDVRIQAKSRTIDDIKAVESSISSALSGRFEHYAVTKVRGNEAHNYVDFILEDVTADRSLTVHDVGEIKPPNHTTLMIQQGTNIDLTTSGSILTAGKTRSGKTTGVISMLLQVLQWGPDEFGSMVIIIDPKKAELSRLFSVVTIDIDGGGRAILAAMKKFAETITQRQAILNERSEETGNAVHWWDIDMHPCFLFVDEFVACRTLFPSKADKSDPGYCLAEFDNLLKRIITMGASAGCFAIISIAEASVQEGGLPSMLRSAMSTKILFRPTQTEAQLLWSSDKLEAMTDKGYYAPGEAWFSSTDGEHDDISFVRFPKLDFAVYRELGTLLRLYGGD